MPLSIPPATPRTILVTGSPPQLQEDTSVFREDDQPWPEREADRVSFARFIASGSSRATGVRLLADDDVRLLVGKLDAVTSIELHFATFTDGRSYTQAKLLRDRLGYRGEIRVSGDVGIDQVHYLREVGVNVFDLRAGTNLEKAQASLSGITVNYRDPTTRRG